MDFTNRSTQPQAASAPATSHKKKDQSKGSRIITGLLVAAVIVLIVALVALISFGGNNNQDKYVDTSKLQAVFLNTGQVYFGNIKTLNSKYFVVTNIYYLQTAQAASSTTTTSGNSNVTLVKLGCELHQPYDQMVINSDQVTFWENLQDNGQVAQAVKKFEQQNPNGQKCVDQSSSSSSTTNAAQNASTSSTSSPATTTTTAAKP